MNPDAVKLKLPCPLLTDLMKYEPLTYILNAQGAHTLLLLHGTGGDEHDLMPLAQKFGKELRLLGVRGNVMENGMPRFFRRLREGVFDEKDVHFRTHELVAFLKELADKEKIDLSKLIALGYSNGANIAGSTLMLYPDFLAGAILLRPMQPLQEFPSFHTRNHTPVYIGSGKEDPMVGNEEIRKYIAVLEEAGFNVTNQEVIAGHNLIRKDLDLAISWFRSHFPISSVN